MKAVTPDFNGKGTMIACEAVELQRDPHLAKEQVEQELLRLLGQKKMTWLKQGIAEDDLVGKGPRAGDIHPTGDTGGHVDEFCRFVSAGTILLAAVSPVFLLVSKSCRARATAYHAAKPLIILGARPANDRALLKS